MASGGEVLKNGYVEREAMIGFIQSNRRFFTVILALIAVGIEYYYSICESSCTYLRGDIFDIDLQYVGIAFMVFVIVLSIFKKDLLLLALLSAGVGVELYLVGFQVWHNTYCLYCLLFGGVLVIQFLINLDGKKKRLILISMVTALLLFPVVFHGSVTPVYAADGVSPPVFGQGRVKVRLYTDYFCGPCRTMESKIEPVLAELIRRNVIALTFIDTPFYRYSSMYARYFLYAMEEKNDFNAALAARNVLITASLENIRDTVRLEEALRNKGVKFRAFDVKQIFAFFKDQFQVDKIEATPSCVIEQNEKKEIFKGGGDIIAALEKLL